MFPAIAEQPIARLSLRKSAITAPNWRTPPSSVVTYMLPAGSKVTKSLDCLDFLHRCIPEAIKNGFRSYAECGFASCRCGSQIEARAAGEHSVFTILNASLRRRAIEIAVRAENHSSDRILAVTAASKAVERGKHPAGTFARKLKDCAVTGGSAVDGCLDEHPAS